MTASPSYVDSPLGIEATTVFNDNTRECADEETLALLRAGVNPLTFPGPAHHPQRGGKQAHQHRPPPPR